THSGRAHRARDRSVEQRVGGRRAGAQGLSRHGALLDLPRGVRNAVGDGGRECVVRAAAPRAPPRHLPSPDDGKRLAPAYAPAGPVRDSEGPLVDRKLIAAHLTAGVSYFGVALLSGLLYSMQFLQAYPFPGVPLLSPGRVRMLHTNSIAYGFFVNCFYGIAYW